MGWAYHGAFVLEYGLLLWLPAIVAGVRHHLRRGTSHVPFLYGAVIVPHAIWLASIGGDHFEYRPQDLYFPFLILLVWDGLRVWAGRRTWVAAAVAAVLLGRAVVLPARANAEFPDRYLTGFPGRHAESVQGAAFLDPEGSAVTRLPVFRQVAGMHRDLLRKTTASLVGVRQEEHALFFAKVSAEADRLAALVDSGAIRKDAHFAMDCVGVIPYRSDLRVLDRHGLTDRTVARSDTFQDQRVMAHDKRATVAYARERGVDFWAFDPVHSLWSVKDRGFQALVGLAADRGMPVFVADASEGYYLLGILPSSGAPTLERLPGLEFRSVADPELRRVIAESLDRGRPSTSP